jgi:putative transposase
MASYGGPRITAELRRRGWTVNPKRVYQLRRGDNLLCVRAAEVRGHHRFQPWPPDLPEPGTQPGARRREPQLWIANLTYIRLLAEFVFRAAILDAYCRRVIGWSLDAVWTIN